ncbi:MAG: glycosyltransferase family 2 protein [Clostridiales bacterium]|nr:glycosyltransferase family 2 protein [Clostridiales bacterium]
MKKISLIVPCFNEEDTVDAFYKKTVEVWQKLNQYELEIVYVDDGSKDRTLQKIETLHEKDNRVKCTSFSRNFGKEAAIFAGLHHVTGDAAVVVDVDLQHPLEKIIEMAALWEQGYEVVEGVKEDRGTEKRIHKGFANLFYSWISKLAGLDMKNSSDFKLIDRKVIEALKGFKEKTPFFRALSFWVGFKSIAVSYAVEERSAGATKWSTKALVKYAFRNLISFTYAPLYMIAVLGTIVILFGVVLGVDALISYVNGTAQGGYPTLLFVMVLTAGAIISSLGIMSVYIAKIYEEIKGRPQYIVGKIID